MKESLNWDRFDHAMFDNPYMTKNLRYDLQTYTITDPTFRWFRLMTVKAFQTF